MRGVDITGRRSGRLIAVRFSHSAEGGRHWICRCDCGKTVIQKATRIVRQRVRSCGCLAREIASARAARDNYRHGHGGKLPSPTYKTWLSMIQRTTNAKDTNYPQYGGRGILVCAAWRDFENFLADMGERPVGLTLDRRDVNGNYEKSNCRWATRSQQQQNKRCHAK